MHLFPLALRLALILAAAWAPLSVATQSLEELRARFQRETDPVGRARAFPKMGDAMLSEVRQLAAKEKFEEALVMLTSYRDDAQMTYDALKASRINAERKSGGFKQFQIHLRRGARAIEDTIASMPFDQRAPFSRIQKDIARLDQQLIDMLFPRQPGHKEEPKAKNKE